MNTLMLYYGCDADHRKVGINMTNSEIKQVMKDWHDAYILKQDTSYIALYDAFHTLRAANLITEKQWKMIIDYDHKLFIGGGC